MKDDLHIVRDERPWGSFDQFTQNAQSTVKILRVNAGKRLSLQRHAHREEFWYVLSGTGTAEVDGISHALSSGVEVQVPLQAAHRLAAGENELLILEIAFGQFDENDIERLEDDFGRIT